MVWARGRTTDHHKARTKRHAKKMLFHPFGLLNTGVIGSCSLVTRDLWCQANGLGVESELNSLRDCLTRYRTNPPVLGYFGPACSLPSTGETS